MNVERRTLIAWTGIIICGILFLAAFITSMTANRLETRETLAISGCRTGQAGQSR
jgi:uncharacterized membrane protein YvbJ